MPRHKKGTLVRVLREMLIGALERADVDRHGELWVVLSYDRRGDHYDCKSLATGYTWVWYPNEITTRKEHEP